MSQSALDWDQSDSGSELKAALRACRGGFVGIGLMTASLNVLYLTGSFFMLLIYDRVLPSHSVPTLVGLVILAFMLYGVPGRARLRSRTRFGAGRGLAR